MDQLQRAIKAADGVTELARRLGVTQSTVSNWTARGRVPHKYGAGIERATRLVVRRWDLWPDEWHQIWPELIGACGAPLVPCAEEAQR